jgi:hypothetical protein
MDTKSFHWITLATAVLAALAAASTLALEAQRLPGATLAGPLPVPPAITAATTTPPNT